MNAQRVLITGASGLLGHHLCRHFVQSTEVLGLRVSHAVDVPGVKELALDFADPADLQSVVFDFNPDLIIHTAGLTNVDHCESNPDLAHTLNVKMAEAIAQAAVATGAKLVHISTDHLFKGDRAFYSEVDPVDPINVYAQTKAEAEVRVLDAAPDALVMRTNFFGKGRPWRPSFSDWIVSSIAERKPLKLFEDIFVTPMEISQLVVTLVKLAKKDATGIFNVVGDTRISKYDLGVAVARARGLPTDLLQRSSSQEFSFAAARPKDMSLSTAKLARFLGEPTPSLAAGLERI